MVAIAYFVINLIENHFLIPKIMNKAVGLNPVLIILALLIGGKIAGIVGIFLAVPIAGAIGLFVRDVMDKKVS
jgi:predicted PurR-regulated permease PerM